MDKEFTGARYFLNIPAEVAHDPRIKRDKAILLFGEIYSMLNVTGAFYMSNKEMAKRLRCKTVKPVKEALNELESLDYIKREIIKDKKTGAVIGRKITSTWKPQMTEVTKGRIQEEPNPSYNDNHPLVTTRTEGGVSEEPQIEHINRTTNRTTNKYSPADAEHHIPYEEIVDYLNQKTNANYKSTAKPTQRLIKARWHEGYRIDDFKKVVDNKAFEWQGDAKMWKYMRPTTLFGSKFDDYLNANNLDKSRKKPTTGGYEELLNGVNIQDIPDDELPF